MSVENQTELLERVQSVLAEVFQVEPGEVGPELEFGDLPQWDSMGHMDVMISLETEFGVEINADTIAGLVNVSAICAHILENDHG